MKQFEGWKRNAGLITWERSIGGPPVAGAWLWALKSKAVFVGVWIWTPRWGYWNAGAWAKRSRLGLWAPAGLCLKRNAIKLERIQ